MTSNYLGMGNTYTLGEFFKEIRTRRGWSQTDMAKAAKVHQTYVSAIEVDRYSKPPLEYIKYVHNKLLNEQEKKELLLVLYTSLDNYLET